jgi:hypothetical protein
MGQGFTEDGMKTFSFATDLHGDRQDKRAVRLFRTFIEDFKPKVRGFGGDIWDFRALRSGASKEEKMHSMAADFESGMEFLEWYRPTFVTLGNHDQRLFDLVQKDGLEKTGPLVDHAKNLIEEFEKLARKLGTVVLPYSKRLGVYRESGLRFTHGFDGNNAAKMARTYGNVLFGHGHRIERMPAPARDALDRPAIARMVGALCLLDMDYNRGQIRALEQEHGWAYGALHGGQRHEVFQAALEGRTVTYAEKIKTVSTN